MNSNTPTKMNSGSSSFPIVGLGASANGLDALKRFLSVLPIDFGFALVLIQQLTPKHKGLLPDLLSARLSSLVIQEISDGLKAQPGRLYVSPPGKEVYLRNGFFQTKEHTKGRIHLPIDAVLSPEEIDGEIFKIPGSGQTTASLEKTALHRPENENAAKRADIQHLVEQLKTMNEESQSANEELRVANEELETSREELQSLNEELRTVNQELKGKIEEQDVTNNDLNNFQASTNIPTIFLDTHFRVKRFTPAMLKLIKLLPSDVGRPMMDMSQKHLGPDLITNAQYVLEQLTPLRQELRINSTWYVRTILPYRTADNRIEGVVVTYNDVTELKRAEEQFRTLADSIPNLAWWANGDGYITWYNRRWFEYTGTTPEQMEGWGWQSVHDPKALPMVMERWQASIATGEAFDMEFPLRGADGVFRAFLTRIIPLKDADGRVVRWFGTNTDVSALKRAGEALRESDERLRFALETSHIGAWDLDLVDHTAFRSLEHDRIFGYAESLPQWTYEMFIEHVLPEDRATVDEKFRRAVEGRGDWSFECRIRRTDSQVRWIWAAGRHRLDAAGAPRIMAGIVQDITERKRAEEELRRSEEKLSLAFHGSITGMSITRLADGLIIDVNERWLEMFGLTREEVVGKIVTGLAWKHPEERTQVVRELEEHGVFQNREVRFLKTTGEEWLGLASGLRTELRGESVILSSILDITERKRAEEALRESEQLFSVLIKNLQSAVALVNESGAFMIVNRAFLSMFDLADGSNIKNVNDRNWSQWQVFDEQGALLKVDEHPVRKAALTGKAVRDQLVALKTPASRELKWVLVSAEPIMDAQGHIHRIICTYHDITVRKQAEEEFRRQAETALNLSEQEFRSLAEAMPQIVWATRADGWNIYFNQQWVDYTGLTMEESYGHGWNTPFHPDDRQRAWDAWQRATQNNERYSLECRLRRADGIYRWWLVRGEPMRGTNGEILKWFGTCTDIEDLKRNETMLHDANALLEQRVDERTAALRESELRFRLALKNSPVSVAIQDNNFVYQWAYNQRTRLPDEVVGKTDADLFDPEDLPPILEAKRRVLTSGIEEHTGMWLTRNGRRMFFDLYYEPMRDASGNITGIGIATVNLTDQKLAEEALKASEEQFRALADSIPNLAWWANGDGYITWYNRRWYDYTGTTPEQMEGWGWQSVHDPEALPKVLEQWKASIATGEPFEMEFPLRGGDGTFRAFLTRGIPVKDPAGRVIRWFGTNTDVSLLKEAENERELLLAEVQRHVAELDAVFKVLPYLVSVHDRDGKYLRVNQAVIDLFGFDPTMATRAEIAHRVKAHYPDGRPLTPENMPSSRALKGETVKDVEYVIANERCEEHVLLFNAIPLKLEERIYGAVFSQLDITERKKAEADLMKLSDEMAARNLELESANKEMEAFIYSIAHDLRAPIRTMSGFAKIISDDYIGKLDAQGQDYLSRIVKGSTKTTRLIDDLLHLAKISRQELDRIEVNLNNMASKIVEELRERNPGKNVEVVLQKGLTAQVDPRLIEVALSNLLENAWKFTSKKEKATIELGSNDKDGETVYYVKDNGAGFDPAFTEKIFRPFHRLHSESEFEGTGIGLTIVERVVHRHGGRIWAEGEVGKGATVYFTLGRRARTG
jgi:PAS domain S-box-containing protein